ncbi:MAG: hypothetical protein JO235_09875 [Chroococcidiopsidaceae cyanobacterium CP_BM_RX_35]|nr:hypothetical protein [Chroococcidiopsidaceae cyanobacterium CP_BM_RX_35]
MPLLTEVARLALQKEAESYSYIPKTGQVGTGDRVVRQQYSSFAAFPESSLYVQLAQAFQALMSEQLALVYPYPFATPLKFNSMLLQKYELGQLGITAHRDSLRSINWVCIFNIAGRGQFCLCEQRCGRNSREVDSSPGNIIFLRAPGFFGVQERPFHYVTNIQVTRYSFGLRQRAFSSAGVESIRQSS